jgi:hypothetical protein
MAELPIAKSAYVQAVIGWLRADELDQPEVDALRNWVQSHVYRKAVREKDASALHWLGSDPDAAWGASQAPQTGGRILADGCGAELANQREDR